MQQNKWYSVTLFQWKNQNYQNLPMRSVSSCNLGKFESTSRRSMETFLILALISASLVLTSFSRSNSSLSTLSSVLDTVSFNTSLTFSDFTALLLRDWD